MLLIPSDRKLKHLFKNSIWIVPTSTLLAYLTVDNKSSAVKDQTIWIIDSYQKGYIFGTSYTTIDGNPSAKTKIVGSITPYGDVLLSFYSNNNITSGSGKFIKINDEWQFVMQMNTLNSISQGVLGLSHWSYMQQITPCDYEYNHLPGVCLSVPQFISLFE